MTANLLSFKNHEFTAWFAPEDKFIENKRTVAALNRSTT